MRVRAAVCRAFLCVVFSCAFECAPAAEAASTATVAPQSDLAKAQLESEKLRSEIAKLKAEIDNLSETNKIQDPRLRRLSAWFGAIGGVIASLITAVVALGSAVFVYKGLNTTQTKKMEQERVLGREKHNMELFQSLGDDNVRVQLAAASVLIQRLESFRDTELTPAEKLEKHTIVQVLVAIAKKSDGDAAADADRKRPLFGALQLGRKKPAAATAGIHPALAKLVADNVVKVLDAFHVAGKPRSDASPLSAYDFQKVQFREAYWKRVDARGVDFFRADLSRAGLKEAHFTKAVLQEANLQGSVLQSADLREADLQRADLRNADLTAANLHGAKFDGAKVAGAVLNGAQYGANADGQVDVSFQGDGSRTLSVAQWLDSFSSTQRQSA